MNWESMFDVLNQEEKKASDLVTTLIVERKNKKISQRELAEMTGLKQSTIARIERDIVVPKLDTFIKIAIALNLDLNIKPKKTHQKQTVESI